MIWLAMLTAGATTPETDTWLLEERIMVQVKPPLPVGWTESLTETRWLVSWQPGAETWTARLCWVEVEPVMGATTSWPETTVAAVPALVRPVAFDGTTFRAGPVVETFGATDQDADGNPGMTLRVSHPRVGAGEVWVRQTVTTTWTGELRDDGVIEGSMTYQPEQEQLGATTWWLRMALKQRSSQRTASRFTLTPLSSGATCKG